MTNLALKMTNLVLNMMNLQTALYPAPPTPADVMLAERQLTHNFNALEKRRDGTGWWSALLGGGSGGGNGLAPKQLQPSTGLHEGEIALGSAAAPISRMEVGDGTAAEIWQRLKNDRAVAAARAEALAASTIGSGTLPKGFSAIKPPTPSEVAEAEKSFQLAVHRQRPGQRRASGA